MALPDKASADTAAGERRDASGRNTLRRSIYSVPVTVTVSIGQKRLSVSEILELQPESIIPLSSRIDDPVDLTIEFLSSGNPDSTLYNCDESQKLL